MVGASFHPSIPFLRLLSPEEIGKSQKYSLFLDGIGPAFKSSISIIYAGLASINLELGIANLEFKSCNLKSHIGNLQAYMIGLGQRLLSP
jgi:hypothetical protein